MKTPTNTKDAEAVRMLARKAVGANIQLLEAMTSIAEILDCSFETAHEWASAMSITLDSEKELKDSDLAELLDAAS